MIVINKKGKRICSFRIVVQGQTIPVRGVEVTKANPNVSSNFILLNGDFLKTHDKKIFAVTEQT